MFTVETRWNPDAFRKMRAQLPERREELREAISKDIAALVELVRERNPLPLLFSLFAKNCLVDPETYEEPEHEGSEARVEYAHSLAVACSEVGTEDATDEEVESFGAAVERILQTSMMFFAMWERGEGSPDAVEETKFLGMMRHLFIRGSSFLAHDTDLIEALFAPHDEFFVRKGLFTAPELIAFGKAVEKRIEECLRAFAAALVEIEKVRQEFLRRLKGADDLDPESVMEALRGGTGTKESIDALKGAMAQYDHVLPALEETRVLRDTLTLGFGDNKAFLTFAKSPGWPSNTSKIYTRPLIRHGGKDYCPNPVLLLRNRGRILEQLIRETDPEYFKNQYAHARGRITEALAVKYFSALLPGANVFENLYYRMTVEGEERRFETDGLVMYGDRLFVLEMKSGPFSEAALRGADKAMASELGHLVGEPYEQGLRTLKYINTVQPARFEWEDGTEAVTVDSAQLRRVYVVNVTLSDIGHVSARLNSARAMGLLSGKDWPWSVFVNDLRVLSEILGSPAEFLLYLERRLAINDLPAIATVDELDYLGMFLKDGLYYQKGELKGLSRLTPLGFTVPIERYYEHLAGRVASAEKPRLNISDWYRRLVIAVEQDAIAGALHVAMSLLSVHGRRQAEIETWAKEYGAHADATGEAHSLTLVAKDTPSLVFCITKQSDVEEIATHERYCEKKRVQTGVKELLFVAIEGPDLRRVTHKVFDGPIVSSRGMDESLARRARVMVDRHTAQHGRPGRNDPCPCNSGRKFKRCCGV